MSEINFDNFLLFHPQSQLTYIRKLSMSYGYYMALAVVDYNNRVTHVGISNSFQIVSFKELSENDRRILGGDRCSSLDPDDLLSVYRINRALKLNGSFKLYRPCRNMRYATGSEVLGLKRLMKSTLEEDELIFEERNNEKYSSAFTDQIDIDLDKIDLTIKFEDENKLPVFNNNEAMGQTKLI